MSTNEPASCHSPKSASTTAVSLANPAAVTSAGRPERQATAAAAVRQAAEIPASCQDSARLTMGLRPRASRLVRRASAGPQGISNQNP